MQRMIIVLALAFAAPAISSPAGARAYDHQWPQWRGPMGTGVAPQGDPPVRWSETENVRWKVELPGRGHASPIVWDDLVFVLTAVEADSNVSGISESAEDSSAGAGSRPRGILPEAELRFVVLALDRATGKVVWQRTANTAVPHEGTHATATWASASAATDGKVLIASFGSNGIYAYDLDGKLLWQRDLGDQQTRNAFGEGSSPALYGSSVVVSWDHEGDSFSSLPSWIATRAKPFGAVIATSRPRGRRRW